MGYAIFLEHELDRYRQPKKSISKRVNRYKKQLKLDKIPFKEAYIPEGITILPEIVGKIFEDNSIDFTPRGACNIILF